MKALDRWEFPILSLVVLMTLTNFATGPYSSVVGAVTVMEDA